MTKRLDIYRCGICGNLIEVFIAGGGELVCCGKPMKHETENTVDAALEKHVPVVEKIPGGFKVTVGSVEHPMLAEHYIEWIEVIDGDRVYRQDLHPGQKPVATFMIDAESVIARESCNLHGLWKK
ncbi:desulfoferrodoxin [Desulfococcaceae bacterium OttesenSCG-928-F15]|nr:desulfoferrodoxin [Desulfococcaceae bacterium OttesenSCG-928-F15]